MDISPAQNEQPAEHSKDVKKVRRKFGESSEIKALELSETQREILELIRKNNRISASAMAKVLSVSSRMIEKNIRVLKNHGILIRHGAPKSGYWEIAE